MAECFLLLGKGLLVLPSVPVMEGGLCPVLGHIYLCLGTAPPALGLGQHVVAKHLTKYQTEFGQVT